MYKVIKNVIKRNEERQLFRPYNIRRAIEKANAEVGVEEQATDDEISKIIRELEKYGDEEMHVEAIQDFVQKSLMQFGRFELAGKYIAYRQVHALARQFNQTYESILTMLDGTNKEVLSENSNKNGHTNSTQRDLMAGEVSKSIADKFILPPEILEDHMTCKIHYHDRDYAAQHMINCFRRDTKFITSEGTFSFKDFEDGDEVLVPDKNGDLQRAVVHSYGVQKLNKVRFRRGKSSVKDVYCTSNHTWILNNGTKTTNLAKEDRILLPPVLDDFDFYNLSCEAKVYWCIGFALGNGSDYDNTKYGQSGYGIRVRLCGRKCDFADYFSDAGFNVTYPDSYCDDAAVVMPKYSKNDFLSNKLWRDLDRECKIALFNGYMSSDGEFRNKEYATGISTISDDIASLVYELAEMSGYYIGTSRVVTGATNFCFERTPLKHIQFTRSFYYRQPWIVDLIEPTDLEEEVWCLEVENTHSFILSNGLVTGNCCLVNIKDMLDNGSVMNNTMIEPPRSFRTACNVTTQYVANIASNQYGGQSVAIKHLGKYLAISRDKIRMRMKKRFDDIGITYTGEQLSKIVEDMLSEELRDGVQLIQYQCISLLTTNGQSPFITLFLQIDDEDPYKNEVAMIVREIIRQRYEGIKNKDGVYVTPTFPKLVYVLDKNNVEGGEFYDITKLCAKCSIKRSYPDYISAKKMREIHDGEVYSCMGCVDGTEVVSYKYNGVVHVESFERMWNKFSLLYKPKVQSEDDNRHLYMEVPNLQIWDTKLEDYTVVKCLIRNVQNKWYDIKLRNGRTIKVTDNHPFETENRGIVYASDLTTDDKILINNFSSSIKSDVVKDIDDRKAWLFGLILCDGCLHNNTISVSIGLDEEDIAEEYIDAMYDIYGFTVNKKYQMRGKKGNYIDLRINLTEDNNYSARYLYNELVGLFEGVNKSDRKIPDEVYTWNESARLSFLAGMIDADGYIHYTDTSNFDTVEIGSVNKELAYGQMYLAQALGYCCSMYKNYYSSKHRKVRYKLSFDADYRIVNYLKSIKKIENFRGLDRTNSTSGFDKVVNVMEIVYYECEDFSYDVTTESEHFEVSGIYSHNCRSFLSEWKITPEYAKENGLPDSEIGAYKWEGRFNQGRQLCPLSA